MKVLLSGLMDQAERSYISVSWLIMNYSVSKEKKKDEGDETLCHHEQIKDPDLRI